MDFANSSNSSAILKEGVGKKKKVQHFADGGAVPEGLDDFISSPSTQQPQAAQPMGAQQDVPPQDGSPQGLDEFIAPEMQQAQYGTPGQQALAGVEGVAKGIAGPLATAGEQALFGVKPEDQLGRQEANPWTSGIGEGAGLIGSSLTGVGEGALLSKAGMAVSDALKGTTLASKIGSKAAGAAIENILLSGSDETSKLLMQDPHQSAQTAAIDIGLSGILGAGIGGGLGAVSPLWKAAYGSKAGQLIEDFKGRINEHVENPEPLPAVIKQLQDHYANISSMSDDVYGPTGLKAQDIAKAMPEMSDRIIGQSNEVADSIEASLAKMANKPGSYPSRLTEKLAQNLQDYKMSLSKAQNPGDIFNATQDLKQTLQEYSKFDKFVKPVDEAYDFVNASRKLAVDLRSKLEDPSVWGNAAKRQMTINKAFSTFKPALDDFEKKFTTEVSGQRTVDPGKINTYMNQLGKPNAEIKQSMMKNYLDASDKYHDVISQSHANLGLEPPIQQTPLNAVRATLKEVTPGAKLADMFLKKGLGEVGGKTLGAGLGAALGHGTGIPYGGYLGSIIGEKAFGPFLSSVLPAIAKNVLSATGDSSGLYAAAEYGATVTRGEEALNRASTNLFKEGSDVLPERLRPTDNEKSKLDKLLKSMQIRPAQLLQSNSSIGHYMPDHSGAMGQMSATAVNYLNSLRPSKDKASPLDSAPTPSAAQKGAYESALTIAQQPLIVIDKIKNGTVTPSDLMTLKTVYPALYTRMSQKLTGDMITHISKGKAVPYKTRIGLSMFTAQPLDSTMRPMSIISAQPQAPQQSPQGAGAPKPSKSSPALAKSAGMYRTPSQAAEMDRQRLK